MGLSTVERVSGWRILKTLSKEKPAASAGVEPVKQGFGNRVQERDPSERVRGNYRIADAVEGDTTIPVVVMRVRFRSALYIQFMLLLRDGLRSITR